MQVPNMARTRWAAIGAAVAVSVGAGGIGLVNAAVDSGERSVFVPITPCRIMDTRAEFQVGPRATPLGANETYNVNATGTVGDCTLPEEAIGLVLNVTALDASLPTFLAVYPAGEDRPETSSLNPVPDQPPTPNAVSTSIGAGNQVSIFNLQGTVNVIADVVGYYADHNHDDRYYTEDEVDAVVAGLQPAGDYVTQDQLTDYVAEMNVGDDPAVLAEIGPLTYTMTCVENAGDIDYTIDITSSVGPWFVQETEYAAGDSYEAYSSSTTIDVPDYEYWYESIIIPSEGLVIADDGYRHATFVGYPGADCRAAGTFLPLYAGE